MLINFLPWRLLWKTLLLIGLLWLKNNLQKINYDETNLKNNVELLLLQLLFGCNQDKWRTQLIEIILEVLLLRLFIPLILTLLYRGHHLLVPLNPWQSLLPKHNLSVNANIVKSFIQISIPVKQMTKTNSPTTTCLIVSLFSIDPIPSVLRIVRIFVGVVWFGLIWCSATMRCDAMLC